MYWGDAKLDKIEMANLDGTGRTLIGTAKNTHFFSFTFHAGNIYITDWTRAYALLFFVMYMRYYLEKTARSIYLNLYK